MSVVIETTLGDLTVDLFTEERPLTCRNFLKLCKMKYYNFSLFHLVQANFIAQTGDPSGTGSGGMSAFGLVQGIGSKYYKGESMPKIKHTKPGLLSMVNCGDHLFGSQFFVTLGSDLQSLDEHCVFGEVTEGQDMLVKLNEAVCDFQHRPYKDIRITHTVILEDPYEDIPGMEIPPSPDLSQLPSSNGRLAADEEVGEEMTGVELEEARAEQEARARATILEIVGDLPHADIAPPENVLFVCKLNPVTSDEDLELIFSRFGKINSCEVIRDLVTGESLQYAFIEFADKKSCEQAYNKMDNVLIDDRRIHVDFSQSVSKIRWKGKGRGVELVDKPDDMVDDGQPKPLMDLRYSSMSMMNRGRDQQQYYRDRDRDRERRVRGDDGRRREDARTNRRREERRVREEERRRRPDRHPPSSRSSTHSSSRRHREYGDMRHGRVEEIPSESGRHHRRYEEALSQQESSRKHREQPTDYKHIKPLIEKFSSKPLAHDNGESVPVRSSSKTLEVPPSPSKTRSPSRKDREDKADDRDKDSGRNDAPSRCSVALSDVGSAKNSADSKKRPAKKRVKKKRRSSSTSSDSSDSSVTSSSSSESSTSSSSSSSSIDRRIVIKKNGKSKKKKGAGLLTKKYYDRKGKLIKVVKQRRRDSSESSDSSSELSDRDRKRKKRRDDCKKKKKTKRGKKGSKKSSDDGTDASENSDSDDSSRRSKAWEKQSKKRKPEDKATKKDVGDKNASETSQNEEDSLSSSQDKKKLKLLQSNTPAVK